MAVFLYKNYAHHFRRVLLLVTYPDCDCPFNGSDVFSNISVSVNNRLDLFVVVDIDLPEINN